jgi:GMP synthase (glutamine-hydrolysing)
MPHVLVVRTGSAGPATRARLGDFTDWFAGLLPAEVSVADALDGAPLPAPDAFGGLVVTGSFASVTRPEPWMERLGAWLLEAARTTPVLGVCFGHQLLARALGGRVERNARGPEAGTAEVELTEDGREDPLFAGLPARLEVQQSHEDHVLEPPPGAVVLARNAHAPVQAFGLGPRIRAIQFHPEFTAQRCRAICEEDRALLDTARPGLADAALASIRETRAGARVLENWVRGFVER